MPIDAIMLIVVCVVMVVGIFYYEYVLKHPQKERSLKTLGNTYY